LFKARIPDADRQCMAMTVSPHVRLFAIVGALAALALGGAFFMLGHPGATEADAVPPYIKPLHPVKKTAHPAAPTKAHPAAKPAKHVKAPAERATAPAKPAKPAKTTPAATKPKPAAVAKPKPAPAAKPKPKLAPLPEGLPAVIGRALRAHPVVVVSVYDPHSKVDAIAMAEAEAGARAVGVGFVALNALSQAQAAPLTQKLGVLPSPTLLIYKRPDQLVSRFDGFADRDTVAQAAQNVLPNGGLGTDTAKSPWVKRANAVCGRGVKQVQAPKTVAEFLRVAPGIVAGDRAAVAKLKRVPLPTAPATRRLAQKLLVSFDRLVSIEAQGIAAVRAKNAARARSLVTQESAMFLEIRDVGRRLGAPACAQLGAR
jgi:hypothetical protein